MIKYYSGLSGSGKAYFLLEKLHASKSAVAVVHEDALQDWQDNLTALGAICVDLTHAPQVVKFADFAAFDSLSALKKLTSSDEPVIVLTTPQSLNRKIAAPGAFMKAAVSFKTGNVLKYDALLDTLISSGYQREEFVEEKGQFSRRGEILDIWPPQLDLPVRVVFDRDTVELMRSFNLATQRSEDIAPEFELIPAKLDGDSSLSMYLKQGCLIYFDTPPDFSAFPDFEKYDWLVNNSLESGAEDAGFKALGGWAGNYGLFLAELKKFTADRVRNVVFCTHEGEKERLEEILSENQWRDELPGMLVGPLAESFYSPSRKLAVFSGQEILYKRRPVSFPKFKTGRRLEGLWEIAPGDYIVHEKYGIGRFIGLKKITRGEQEAEYICVGYKGGDKLYVPVDDFRVVQKYVGIEGARPSLHSMDTAAWERTKKRAREGAEKLAAELLKLYAERKGQSGFVYPEDTTWEKELADSFPYTETEDQVKAIEAVKLDLRDGRPMERLICGDVGFGKTEVAVRAAFKVALSSKQVAVLVPTTVLAEQHFNTFSNRLAPFPVNVAMLSRFQTKAGQKKVIAELKAGIVDIVIGTHRLLQKDLSFSDLGMLIIDEEHRFGVKQKEKMKALKNNVEVLLLSATPIPRTLAFALASLRELSVIETPPYGRLPIETHLGPFDERTVKTVIQAELSRGGQVFYVYNKVETILSRAAYLRKLLPGAKLGIVHGQLPSAQIEKAMWDFMHKKIDVLIASTIIESGLDIPSANTMIVEEAENFGLAQLYQLRGRIGREKQKAYCYLFYTPSLVKEDAARRLESLQEFSELGSGFRLALRDLEIRGAGNILGREQHGFVREVGFELYSRLLEEASKGGTASGKDLMERKEEFRTTAEFTIPAFFPPEYIEAEDLRIIFYRKLAAAGTEKDFEAVKDELADRFGPLPEPARNLFEIARLRLAAEKLKIKGLNEVENHIELYFSDKIEFKPNGIPALAADFANMLEFMRGENAGIKLKKSEMPRPPFEYLQNFLLKFKEYVIIKKSFSRQ